MTFPVNVRHRSLTAVIYAKTHRYPYYRVAYRAAGKRIVRSYSKFVAARKAAMARLKELWKGQHSSALTPKEATDALAIRDTLETFRMSTGRRVTAIQAVNGFLDAVRLLPDGQNLTDAIQGYLQGQAVVSRKPVAEAVEEFCNARQTKTKAEPGKRPSLNPVYAADTARHLTDFAATFPATAVSELTKAHLDKFIGAHEDLSAKTRNHIRSTVRMFLAWCMRRDYLAANTRLLEADGLRKEAADAAPIDFYRPSELAKLLENSTGPMRAVIALQALAGLRLQEALRLDWRDVFAIDDHIEVSTAKSKTRQRRLVEIVPALQAWLAPYRGQKGQVTPQTLSVYTHEFLALRKKLKIPSRKNGLRHGFVTYHFALNSDENHTAAQAGNSPAMIHAHYKGLATKADAEKWFDVRPT